MSRISKDIFILLVAFIVLLSNIQITLATVETGFNDIKPTDWFYNDVIEAQRVGLIAGVGNNMFAPNKTISYAEYITILTRVLGADTSNKGNSNHWAAGNIEAAKKLGIISEGEVTNYDAGIPREVMAVFTCKALGVKPETVRKSSSRIREMPAQKLGLTSTQLITNT